MTHSLQKYTPLPEFEARLRQRYGCSLKDDNQRFAVQNDLPTRILAGKSQNRAAQLLSARGSGENRNRSRGFGFLAPLAGGMNWPEPSQAGTMGDPAMLGTWLSDWAVNLAGFDWNGPGVSLALGGALFLTQIVAMRQRKRILNCLTETVDPEQLPLFPGMEQARETTKLKWTVDAASRQGLVRKENQDACAVLSFDDESKALIVCDGAGGIKGGREAAQSAVAAIKEDLKARWQENRTLTQSDLEAAIAAAREFSLTEDLSGVTTVLVVLLQGEDMTYATLGDGAVAVIWPDGMVAQVQVPHHSAGAPSNVINAFIGHDCRVPPRVGHLRLEPGAFVMAMTDGASDLFPFEDFALDRAEYAALDGLADELLAQLEAARDPDTQAILHHDNMTLALARLETGGDHD